MATLPVSGAVLGVDVGFSVVRKSSAVCLIEWDDEQVVWSTHRFRASRLEQEAAITQIAGARLIQAAAFDGPLRRGFDVIGRYRLAERLLTARLHRKIGKPGQASSPAGLALNQAANICAAITLEKCRVASAAHAVKINEQAVVEAFPTAFLGVMLREPGSVAARRSDRSDLYFQRLAAIGTLPLLLTYLLPRRSLSKSFEGVTNHDDRAALICAVTALSVAAGDYTAVGGTDGWIILPPYRFIRSWARADLEANAREEEGQMGCLYQTGQRLIITGAD